MKKAQLRFAGPVDARIGTKLSGLTLNYFDMPPLWQVLETCLTELT